jgi:hypothetical protein
METKESRSFLDKVWVESEQANVALTQVYEGMRVYDMCMIGAAES